ncbi:type VII secretion target [Mangrovihabitans endophyticus]|uniref:Excreted virulence factor EspC, type VII ESX diderm n=1 Tax=Mangrovihabitans endophyticus TaxID=1751298 RepID=A0A8J3BZQ4_9ACTN|nr:type VII secretion target [Mangrovihabitans endophyticus]GGK88680.1 hypothetical protein GCM10012284_23430 [Mangrovihabitans endophyticus]
MTGTAKQFQVGPDDLMVHARAVDAVGDGLGAARQASVVLRMDAGAYGQICHIIPDLLNGLQTRMIDGIAAAADTAHDTADALRSVADGYASADRAISDQFRNLR